MKAPDRADRAEANAAILLWQSRYRILLIAAVGSITLTLRWAGTLSVESVIATRFGGGRALLWTTTLVVSYLAFIGGLALYLRARRQVGNWAVVATIAADIVTFTGAVLLGTPPEWYARALILATFSLQLTLLYFGWRAAAWSLLGVAVAYVTVIVAADRMGSPVMLVEALWTLGLFTLGMSVFLSLHADLSERLSTIVQIFDRAHAGDFSLAFDEDSGTESERITVIGGAYDKMRTQLTHVILTDTLTQCYNPRGFEQLSAREIARAARTDAALAMLALDLDHFKDVNDTYGHLVGDEVLREIGGVLRQTARLSDVVARTGGEEFAILAPDTDEEGAMLFAQRLLDAIRGHKFASLRNRRLTVSIGIAFASARTDGVLRLLRVRADEALYVAKRSGRDRLELWREGKATRASQMDLRAIPE